MTLMMRTRVCHAGGEVGRQGPGGKHLGKFFFFLILFLPVSYVDGFKNIGWRT